MLARGQLLALTAAFLTAVACGNSAGDHDTPAGGAGAPPQAGTDAGGSQSASAGQPQTSGGTGGEGPTGGQPSSSEAACSAFANATCERSQACLPRLFRLRYSSLGDCSQWLVQQCQAELEATGSGRNEASVAACGSELAAQSCAEWAASPPASCRPAGSLAGGTGCKYGSQCASSFCEVKTGSWCGTCQPRPAAGGTCDPEQHDCDKGLSCAYVCPDQGTCAAEQRKWLCAEPHPLDGPCEFSNECAADLVCNSGVCSPGKHSQEDCSTGAGDKCDFLADLSCVANAAGGVCKPNAYALEGEACDLSQAQFCAANGACLGADGAYLSSGPGTCGPAAASGEACDASHQCRAPGLCQNKQCVLPSVACP
jgi:hypothetical protein